MIYFIRHQRAVYSDMPIILHAYNIFVYIIMRVKLPKIFPTMLILRGHLLGFARASYITRITRERGARIFIIYLLHY